MTESIYTIPLSQSQSWYEQSVVLDGVEYRLRLMWSERERRWYLDVMLADGTLLAAGRKIVADQDVLGWMSSDDRLPGMLLAVDMTGAQTDPDLRDLGTRVLLYYLDAETLGE
jgi:hypothetical protein